MAIIRLSFTKEAVDAAELEVVMPPMDLGDTPMKTITVENTGTKDVAAMVIQTAPAADGPWIDEDLSATGLETLAAGEADRWQATNTSRYIQLLAKGTVLNGGGSGTDLTVWVDAVS